MIDLHAHLLPAIDDGAADVGAAVAQAAAAAAEGVHTIAATPHLRPDFPGVRAAELAGRTADLQAALDAEGVGVALVVGGEVDVFWGLRADEDDLRRASFGQRGHDLLVETPYGALPPMFEDLLFQIRARGYRLLLAHPERSPSFQRDPRRLAGLVERGTLLQVTAHALASRDRRSRSGRFARDLVREGLAHVIASDSHAARVARESLRAGVEGAARDAPLRATWMVTDAPAAILAGEPLPPPPAERARRRRLRRWR